MRVLVFSIVLVVCCTAQWSPLSEQGRSAIVHLFEWRWKDIADECENFLAPYGYAGVQVSPPNENVVAKNNDVQRPWWERYQPISYKLETRSGTEEDFKDMVRRCNDVGVRIYADAVINHMSGWWPTGTAATGGSSFDAGLEKYDGVPYSKLDFNDANCYSNSGGIDNWNDINQVRNCKLEGLNDLNQSKDYVIGMISDYLNHLICLGVAGFRIDAAKHIWPGDLDAILEGLNDLNTNHGFPNGSRAFIYQEVKDFGTEPIKAEDYYDSGRVTEFRFADNMMHLFHKQNQLHWLSNFGEAWGMQPSGYALVFVDNHDSQRDGSTLSYKDSRPYKMATAYTLAWDYGEPKVMSSFKFDNRDQGPPHDDNYNLLPVTFNDDLTCNNGYVCEHRWRQIYNMVHFRNVAGGEAVSNWWDNGSNQIAFCRGNKAFLAINNDDYNLNERLQTCLPAGDYCDVISGNLEVDQRCTGVKISVGSNGKAQITIDHTAEDPMVAIHLESRIGSCVGNDFNYYHPFASGKH
nr:alpha-amylase [Chrysogorgia stellata]